jgi:hypothetical protein
VAKQTIGSTTIHTFPLPPEAFDPLSASEEALARHGFPRRPDHRTMPEAAARWAAAFSRYSRANHVAPEFRPLETRHAPNQRTPGTFGHVNGTSKNWSGSVLFIGSGDTFLWIAGSWAVPHAYATKGAAGTEYSSAWLGIDGDRSGDVMQAGTATDSDGACYAWFEWYPNFSIAISNFAVAPGDVIHLVLCAASTTRAWLSMGNITSGQYTSFAFQAPAGTALVGNCAEAIVERPTVGGSLAELPRYGDVFFDDTTAYSARGHAFDIGLGTPISMVADDGVTVISAPTFEADTDSFKCSYTGP